MSETTVEVKNQATAPNSAKASNVGGTNPNGMVSNNGKIIYGQSITGGDYGNSHAKPKHPKLRKVVKVSFCLIAICLIFGSMVSIPDNYTTGSTPTVTFISSTQFEYGGYNEISWRIDGLSSSTTEYQLSMDGEIVQEGILNTNNTSLTYSYGLSKLPIGRHVFKLQIKDEASSDIFTTEFHDSTVIIDVENYIPSLSYSSPTGSFEFDSESYLQWDTSDSSIEDPYFEILASAPYVDSENLEYFNDFERT